MRHRERILRIAAETAEKMGLDPRDKNVIDSILTKRESHEDDKFLTKNKEEVKEEVATLKIESPPKKKNPFPPKKKKAVTENSEVTEVSPQASTVE